MIPSTRRARGMQAGFTLIEVMVVVAVIAIISAIAIPSARSALRKARHASAYKSMKVLETGIQSYMLDRDVPPLSLNTRTLEPLVSLGYIPRKSRGSILGTIEGDQLYWYYGWAGDGIWWDYDYGYAFRPKKDPSNVTCYLWPEGIWRWEGAIWTQVL